MKKLITLEENNNKSFQVSNSWNTPQLNGIACPKCGCELYDSNPMVILATYPAKKTTRCSSENCDYSGARLC